MAVNQRCGPPGVKLATSGQSAGSFSGRWAHSSWEKGLRVSIWVQSVSRFFPLMLNMEDEIGIKLIIGTNLAALNITIFNPSNDMVILL